MTNPYTEELIEAGANALYSLLGHTDRKPDWHSGDAEHLQAAAVIDAVEPIIRADEFEKAYEDVISRARLSRKQLREQVEALPTDRVTVLESGAQIHVARESLEKFKADVLALLPKEASDD
jgi:hypothetical protein